MTDQFLKTCVALCDGGMNALRDSALCLRALREAAGELYFVGNGGSAAIASHMAIDFMNKGQFIAYSFNDLAALTCLANDYGYNEVFSRQIDARMHADGDILVAISSSGESENIVNAIRSAKRLSARVITLTGFSPDNRVRGMGTYNFHVPWSNYGVIETAHLGILHALLSEVSP